MVNSWVLGWGFFGGQGGFAVLFCFGCCGFWVFLGGNKGVYCVVSPDGESQFLWSTKSDV